MFVCLFFGAAITEGNNRYDSETAVTLGGASIFLFVVTLLVTIGVGVQYNSIKSTANAKLEVLNSQNEIVLAQIEPLVQQALNYESNTYKELKMTPENIVAFSNMYPQLQANAFIQSQINIIVENQKEIKDLKLRIASLNAYHLWLFTKKE
jgi:hypothetical protein